MYNYSGILEICNNEKHIKIMIKLSSPRSFSFLAGLILFLLGLFGFAFRAVFTGVGGRYLLLALILGFWGLVVAVQKTD